MPISVGHDTAKTLTVGDQSIAYYSIPAATEAGLGDFSKLPAALKVVLENMLRFEDDKTVTVDDIKAFAEWGAQGGKNPREIAYRPARVLLQDFTGVPAVVDLAAMRDALVSLGGKVPPAGIFKNKRNGRQNLARHLGAQLDCALVSSGRNRCS